MWVESQVVHLSFLPTPRGRLKFRLKTETLYLTFNLIDRFLERVQVSRSKLSSSADLANIEAVCFTRDLARKQSSSALALYDVWSRQN